ncbi:MAG: DUF3488 and transglutaminase-like domain-containing protein [Chromatiales bacterium]
MSSNAFNQRKLSAAQLYSLMALLFLATWPHFFHFSLWIGAFFLAVLLTRVLVTYAGNRMLSRWMIYVFLFAGLVNVAIHYRGSAVGKDFGVSLLVSMLALKLLEVKSYRDGYVLLFLTCFLMVTQFLYNQNLGFAVYLFSLLPGVVLMLLWLNRIDATLPLRHTLQHTAGSLLLSAPLMLVLFVLFPRLDAPLWAITSDGGAAVTGISGKITPGSISQLSQSSATAFRIKFDNDTAPPQEQLYWRGPVLTQTDGISWLADEEGEAAEIQFRPQSEPIHYQLTIEPSQQQWLFALDFPGAIPSGSYMTERFSVRHDEKISKRKTFAFTSYTDYQTLNASEEILQQALYVPDNISQRTRDFVSRLQGRADNPKAFILAVLEHFNQQNFVYTLKPPLLGNNPTDEFLFETRKGFCEHYATSFVILMRLAGIPARVVAGYQGGEWNPTGKHLIVRQSDAHAWAEVWLENTGWLRFDPTAAVAPERIERNLDPSVQTEGSPVIFRISSQGALGSMLQQLRWFADSVDLNWHRWVVGFSPDRQARLLQSFGLDFLKGYKLGIAAVGAAFFIVFFMALASRLKKIKTSDPAKKVWDRFCNKLQQQGINCAATDGPQHIALQAQQRLPEKAASIDLITRLYLKYRYAREQRVEDLHSLRTLVRKF